MNEHKKEFNKYMNEIAKSGMNNWDIFGDFCSMSTIALSQPIYRDPKREQLYMDLVGRYKKKNVDIFPKMLGTVVLALEDEPHDFLGQIFMENNFGNKCAGQFFTPYNLSLMIAKINLCEDSVEKMITEKGYISISEPCCGSGGMIIACNQVMIELGYNPSKTMWVEAWDISTLCFSMAYIQLSLLGVAGKIINGNTLSMERFQQLLTPMGAMYYKKDFYEIKEAVPMEIPSELVGIDDKEWTQAKLF